MKHYSILVTILLHLSIISYAQSKDTLNVWAESGLLVRSAPNIEGTVIGKLDYGEKIIVKSHPPPHSYHSHIVFRETKVYNRVDPEIVFHGNFLEIDFHGKKGYVFDGFLSKLPVVKISMTEEPFKREKLPNYLKRVYGELKTIEKTRNSSSTWKRTTTIYNNGNLFEQNILSGFANDSYILYHISFKEAYLLIQAIIGFEKQLTYGDAVAHPITYNYGEIIRLKFSELCEISLQMWNGHVLITTGCSC